MTTPHAALLRARDAVERSAERTRILPIEAAIDELYSAASAALGLLDPFVIHVEDEADLVEADEVDPLEDL